ncbi:MAG: cytochrome c oxidase assembly protein [Legionellales bacterium]|nr:cytochrome c oxidase assembly protein [Legionellales bacterium]
MDVSNRRLVGWLAGLVVVMFGFAFALVPLYNTLCQVLSINGKTNNQAYELTADHQYIDQSREVTVEFVAYNRNNLRWDFEPMVTRFRLHPGEMRQLAFYARNNSDQTMTVQAIPSVSPGLAAKYLKKTECFCFEQQTLESGEAMEMPLMFHLDPDLPKDIHTLTLSYSLFDVTGRRSKSSTKTGRIA